MSQKHSIVAVGSEVTAKFAFCDQGISKHKMKSVLFLGQIMFYSRIFNSQAQLGTRDIQRLDYEKVVFTLKS